MTLPFKLVSADSHIAEPPDLWTRRIEPHFADRAPRLVSQDGIDYFVVDPTKPRKPEDRGIGIGLLATKRKYTDPEGYDFGFDGCWRDVPESAYQPDQRVRELDLEGIEAELLYPTLGLGLFGIRDREFRYACLSAYNEWLADYCAAAPGRLFGVAVIATDSLERDIAELERCARAGLQGAMVSISQKSGSTYGDAEFDDLWAAAAALEMPVSLHVAASETSFHATGNMWADFACVFTPTMYTIVTMIFSGLFDRHPGLKVLSVENDASWALAVLERMDDRWLHDRHWATGDAMTSGRKPSEIFHDQVACTFMRDRTAILNREIIGRGNLMWGSDFPHFDGAWPHSSQALERQFDGVPPEDQRRIGRSNAVDFYKLPIET
ncbi:MAG: amidohydrolase [Sphingomonadales bacterium]|nr:amidohydrolase [Sphingomonadales bacterium]